MKHERNKSKHITKKGKQIYKINKISSGKSSYNLRLKRDNMKIRLGLLSKKQ